MAANLNTLRNLYSSDFSWNIEGEKFQINGSWVNYTGNNLNIIIGEAVSVTKNLDMLLDKTYIIYYWLYK